MDWIIGMVLVLGVMILVHEWGHFLMARLFGVRVDVFSIGFGPRLFGWKRGATDYRVSALPLGGYVRMAGQDLSEVDSGKVAPTGAPDELMSKPRWQRALISFAGPAVNLVFPVFLLTCYYMAAGMPSAAFLSKPVQIVGLPANSQTTPAPFQPGDTVVSLNDVKNPTWEQAENQIRGNTAGGTLKLEVENKGVRRHAEITVKQGEPIDRILGYLPIPAVIGDTFPGAPADRAGIREKDVIEAVNGQKVEYWDQFVDYVRGSGGKPLQLDVRRNGQVLHLTVTPKQGVTDASTSNYQIGVGPDPDIIYHRIGVAASASAATGKTLEMVADTLGVVGKLFSGRVSVKQLQGAVGITRLAGEAVRKGPSAVISVMVLISVNLGILNLLPIPILDGGNILLLAIEGGMRRDLSLAFKERFIQVGLVFLFVLIAYAMYNDVVRLLPPHS
ncbi:MAG TPA: RIP metalloprotease RseP [Candidatus Acidoferrum sp.]|nr:RIP metalloprotease RseP [Candidatus Acidoferrum sp.]